MGLRSGRHRWPVVGDTYRVGLVRTNITYRRLKFLRAAAGHRDRAHAASSANGEKSADPVGLDRGADGLPLPPKLDNSSFRLEI
jgi:hypothetical protein